MKHFLYLIISLLTLSSCDYQKKMEEPPAVYVNLAENNQWKKLWYDGKAEINVYETDQARYSDIHPGTTVLIFVTEDFLTEKQVKNETHSGDASTSVLKTNLIRKFNTGIYDYSIMTSTFTPVDHEQYPNTLKVSLSSQDWCGQSFMQLNLENDEYQVSQYSYFEEEGDRQYNIEASLSEDELFNQIRFNPEILPTGNKKMLPSLAFSRLKHIEFKPYPVEISRAKYTETGFEGDQPQNYKVYFPDFDRTIEIIYEADFPFDILGWKDTYPVLSGKKLTSTFKRISSERVAYWSKHDASDSELRNKIGL